MASGMAATTPEAGASSDNAGGPGGEGAGYSYDFQGVDVSQVLDIYAELVGRTLIRGPVPAATIILQTQTPLTKSEAIEALQAVLALNGIAVVNIGDKFVKVLPAGRRRSGRGGSTTPTMTQFAEPGLLRHAHRAVEICQAQRDDARHPAVRANWPTPSLAIDSNGILVIRDNAENVKRMLEMIDKMDVSVPAEYISEVIPIRYAKADDIASALNSLGGGGGATVSIGSCHQPRAHQRHCAAPRPAVNGMNGRRSGRHDINAASTATPARVATSSGPARTAANPNGTPHRRHDVPAAAADHHQPSVRRPGGGGEQQPIQIFGQTKIIADERSNSLLIYATRQDMETIKDIIAKLDVLLAQVLIESIIMDVRPRPTH